MNDPFPTPGIDFYKGKTVCVTGATGLIGSYAVKLLAESGAFTRVICHSRKPNEFSGWGEHQLGLYDLMDPEQVLPAVHDCEIVVNCAGITGGIGIVKHDPISYVGPATVLAANVIHACHLEKVERMGFLSSTTVYAAQDHPVVESPQVYLEEPYKLYWGIGWSKRFLEKLCLYYHERVGLKVAVVRPSGAYGRFDNFDESTSHVIPGMVNRSLALESGQPFKIWGDGQDVRDFIHAQDVARGFLLAIAKVDNADPINLASGKPITTMDLAEEVLDAVESDAEIVCDIGKPTALRARRVNVGKARQVLGFEAQISLEDGLLDTVAWRRANT
jgi:GDP-L-fucose synthase